jgi:hypothetical protein
MSAVAGRNITSRTGVDGTAAGRRTKDLSARDVCPVAARRDRQRLVDGKEPVMTTQTQAPQQVYGPEYELRRAAIRQLRRKRGLQAHVLAYVLVNLFLNGIWLLTDPGGFYWPMFPLFGWGIGLAFNVWGVYSPAEFDDAHVQREMARLSR